MQKNVSSLKISNIILCVVILILFVIIGTRIRVHAEQITASSVGSNTNEEFEISYEN